MKKYFWLKTALLLVLVAMPLSFFGCKRISDTYNKVNNKDGTEAEGPSGPVFAVNTTHADQGLIQDYLALSGDIMASSTVDTYSDAAGKVSRLYVSVGSRVQKNDPVAEVDPSRPGMEFRPSLVKAPVSGTVIAVPAQIGMTVSQAVPLVRISGTGGLEIKLHVAERFISRIAMNQSCEITLDAWPGETFRGSISEISPTVDATSRTMEIRVAVENPSAKLKAGMFAKVKIVTEQKESIVKIPASAMIQRFGENYVFVVESVPKEPRAPSDPADATTQVARKKIIQQGIIIDGVLEVQQGLEPGDEVIIRGQTLLEDGAQVNVIDRVAPMAAN